jgi:membrane protease YdiL (CAAX protease family)
VREDDDDGEAEDEAPPKKNAARDKRGSGGGTWAAVRKHLSGRVDPLTSAIFVFPIFLIYQLGILTGKGQNGVDFVTSALIQLSERDLGNYLIVLAASLVVYAAVLIILRKRGRFNLNAFLPVVAESAFYALTMGTVILAIMSKMSSFVPGLSIFGGGPGPIEIVIISAGAGIHEELIFRVVGMGGLSWLLSGMMGKRRAWLVALVVSSLVFSLAHHIGPAGESFTFAAFVFRALAGVFFALVYALRGFAVAVWTHMLYDVYVLSFA